MPRRASASSARGEIIAWVSHCLLNQAAVVRGDRAPKKAPGEVIRLLIARGVGIVQLPCPEVMLYGLRRWGHAREQFDHPAFRDAVAASLVPYIRDLRAYLQEGASFLGVVGVDGSPSCGVTYTYGADSWFGEISAIGDFDALCRDIHREERSGVMMDVLSEELARHGIFPRMFATAEGTIEETVRLLHERIDQLRGEV